LFPAPNEFSEPHVDHMPSGSRHVRVSSVSARYAWAQASGPNYDNSGILRRPGVHGQKWKMIVVAGGGIQPCSYWYKKVPRRVVKDLKVTGYTEGSGNFDYHRC
jgi:hypothetical protein